MPNTFMNFSMLTVLKDVAVVGLFVCSFTGIGIN